jgi:hypothetical protein
VKSIESGDKNDTIYRRKDKKEKIERRKRGRNNQEREGSK